MCGPCLNIISRTISESQGSEELVGELVRGLRFSPCELLLLEDGS
jgi:hypothetical protein